MKRQFKILIYGYEPQNSEMKRTDGKILIYTQNLAHDLCLEPLGLLLKSVKANLSSLHLF